MAREKNTAFADRELPIFSVKISFDAELKQPQRIFHATSEFINALETLDMLLLLPVTKNIKPIYGLDAIEINSIRTVLKQLLNGVDDNALHTLDWKPLLGRYLVKAKYCILEMLEENNTLPDIPRLQKASDEIQILGTEMDIKRFPYYRSLTPYEIAGQSKKISDSLARLEQNESVEFCCEFGKTQLDNKLVITQEQVDTTLIHRVVENKINIILMVRKPDFLGKTKWEFKNNKKNISANIDDKEWLKKFQKGELDIRPGDALSVILYEKIFYSIDGEVVDEETTVIKVNEVIKVPASPSTQALL